MSPTVEERECLRVEGRGRSSCAKREPEERARQRAEARQREEERKKDKKLLSERAKLTKDFRDETKSKPSSP